MDGYNYSVFTMANESPAFGSFRDMLHAGERAPSFTLEDLADGQAVELKQLWKNGLAVLEFGSFT